MSDNAATVAVICAVLASLTLSSLFSAWRDRGVAKYNAIGARDQTPSSDPLEDFHARDHQA